MLCRSWFVFSRRFVGGCLFISIAAVSPATHGVTVGTAVQIGTNENTALDEVSGVAVSRANSDTLWVHNDSGDSARFFAMSRQGTLLGTFPFEGLVARDWEDMAIGHKPGGGNYLYFGDIGDNGAGRTSITIYRTDEPSSTAGAIVPVGGYSSLNLQYPGGPRNAESLFVDPLSGDMFIITKTAVPEIYSVPTSAFDDPVQTVVLTPLGTLGGPLYSPTSADISPDGRFILVRNASPNGYLYERTVGQSVADLLHSDGILVTLGIEPQGEALAWAADGTGFYSTSEFSNRSSAPIYSYEFFAPPAQLAGDFNHDDRIDAADYTVWRDSLGQTGPGMAADVDGNEVVDMQDYEVWAFNFGMTQSTVGAGDIASGVSVPEPTSCWMVLAGLFVAAGRFRRR